MLYRKQLLLMYVQTRVTVMDIQRGRTIGPQVLIDFSLIPDEIFPADLQETLVMVDSYVNYEYSGRDRPDWVKDEWETT